MNSYRPNLFPVPVGFHDILRELSSSIIQDQPEDILFYGMLYFESKLNGSKFVYDGARRIDNANHAQRMQIYNQIFRSNQANQAVEVQPQKNMHKKQTSQPYPIYVKTIPPPNKEDFPENIPNIRMMQNYKKRNYQEQTSEHTLKNILRYDLKIGEIPVNSTQSIQIPADLLKSTLIIQEEGSEAVTCNNMSSYDVKKHEKTSDKQDSNNNIFPIESQKGLSQSDSSLKEQFIEQQTQHNTNPTIFQDDKTLNKKFQYNNTNQFDQNHFSQDIHFTNILEDKLLLQGLEEDFQQKDLAEVDVQKEEVQHSYQQFLFDNSNNNNNNNNHQNGSEQSLSIIQSNYNISANLKNQILNCMVIPEKRINEGRNMIFSNKDQMNISMVESMKLGEYQKAYLYVNIMSARNLPLCMNATCEVYLEGLPNQKVISQTVYNNNEPDWYYLRKKLILFVPKNTQCLQDEMKDNPLFLCANIYETKYSNKSQERNNDLATFRIPLKQIFEKEGQWYLNNYFDCNEEFSQSQLYLQVKFQLIQVNNSSLLQQNPIDSGDNATLNREIENTITKSSNEGIMASVDLNKENDHHARIIQQLILSLSNQSIRTIGTLKIIIIKARMLKHASESVQIQSPSVEYKLSTEEDNLIILNDPNPNDAKEPIWFHSTTHKIDVDLSHKPSILLKVFDVRDQIEDNKVYMGEINIDLSIVINQPGKWLINNYYDILFYNNPNHVTGQVYLQSKFIPGGLEQFHQEQFGPLIFLD